MKVITAHSYRGGTGKTNVIANLSLVLAKNNWKVAAVDSDVTHPSLHIMYGLGEPQPHPTLTEFLLGKCDSIEMVHELSQQYKTSGKLYLVPAKLDEDLITRIIREGYDLGKLFKGLREVAKKAKLDFMLIDTRPGLDERTMLILAMTDILLMLTRNDEADFRGTLALLDIVERFKIPRKCILPCMISSKQFENAKKEFAKQFKDYRISFLDSLPFSRKLYDQHSPSIDTLFISKYSKDPYSLAIAKLSSIIEKSC